MVLVFSECAYSCHVHCADKAPHLCPVPSDQSEYDYYNIDYYTMATIL